MATIHTNAGKPSETHIEKAAASVHSVDLSKEEADREQARELAVRYGVGTSEESRLKRKLDWRLLPCTWILYFLGFLDRANIGNAKTGGLERDFSLTSDQYSIITLVFFISYLICEVPSNMILTRVRPHIFLPGLGVFWGTIAALMGAAQNWTHIAGLRFMLGVAEAGFAPGCAFYLSSWYRKYELTTRYAFLYTSVPIAGAISGLLAGVITEHLDGAAGIAGWRWLFIIEGLASIVAAIVVFLLLPDYPSTSKRFLNEEETILACNRLAMDGIALTQGAHAGKIPHWIAFKMCVKDWRTWLQCAMFTLVTGSMTMQYFIPTIVGSFGWKGYVGQYHTIPFYATGLFYLLTTCYLSDRFKTKWPFVAGLACIGFAFFIAITVISNKMAQYVLTIFAFGTLYGCSPLIKTWVADVIPHPPEKRAIAIALINSIGNGSSIYASWLWPKKDAPRYIIGFATTTSWLGLLLVLTLLSAYLFNKFPVQRLNQEEVMASELKAQRQTDESKGLTKV